jgi:transposase
LRLLWREEVGRVDPSSLVFVDEMGTHTSLGPLYAYAPIGERAFFEVPRNLKARTRPHRLLNPRGRDGRSVAIEDSTDSEVFEAYVEEFLAPTLEEGQVVVLDKLGAHRRTERVRELIEGRGADLLFLPSYSPDLNPIEEAFSKIKNIVRKAGARTRKALNEAISETLAAITLEDAAGWFAHCGYRPQDQPL